MTTVNEIAPDKTANSQVASLLNAGTRQLSLDQQIEFNLYRRYVFPLDGMNYWMKVYPNSLGAKIRSGPGLTNVIAESGQPVQVVAGGLGAVNIVGGYIINPYIPEDQSQDWSQILTISLTQERTDKIYLLPGQKFTIPANPQYGVWAVSDYAGHEFTVVVNQAITEAGELPLSLIAKGSLHVAIETQQEEDASIDVNTVTFNTFEDIKPFNEVGTDYTYIGLYDNIRFSFTSRRNYYEAANLYHYIGEAIYSVNDPLIIDNPNDFNPTLTISDSLPIWINMPNYVPPYSTAFTCSIPLYPSFLVDDNMIPPFGVVHIEDTESLSASPIFDSINGQTQLCRDEVKVTLYGVDNNTAGTFLAFVEQYSEDWNKIGMANMPSIRDVKRTQSELNIISKKKEIKFLVNYLQSVARDEARQFIERAKIQNQFDIILKQEGLVTDTGEYLVTDTGQVLVPTV